MKAYMCIYEHDISGFVKCIRFFNKIRRYLGGERSSEDMKLTCLMTPFGLVFFLVENRYVTPGMGKLEFQLP